MAPLRLWVLEAAAEGEGEGEEAGVLGCVVGVGGVVGSGAAQAATVAKPTRTTMAFKAACCVFGKVSFCRLASPFLFASIRVGASLVCVVLSSALQGKRG